MSEKEIWVVSPTLSAVLVKDLPRNRYQKFLERFEKEGDPIPLFICIYCEDEPAFDRKEGELEGYCPDCGYPMNAIIHQNYDFTKRVKKGCTTCQDYDKCYREISKTCLNYSEWTSKEAES